MKLFNTIALEINARCNRSCKFCPVAYNTRPDERMDLNTFKKCLDDLSAIKYSGRVELYIYNEPMKDLLYLEECVKLTRTILKRSCIMIATNGDYIKNPEMIIDLYNWGINQVLVNCYSPGLYEKRSKWIGELPSDVLIDGPIYSKISPKKKSFKMLDKSNPSTFGSGVFSLVNRAGNIGSFKPALTEPVNRMCAKPFRIFNINWRGEALVCCQDYHSEISVGSVSNSTLLELWNSPILNTYRSHLLEKDRSLPLCRTCDCHAGAYSHNVDTNIGKQLTPTQLKTLLATKTLAEQPST